MTTPIRFRMHPEALDLIPVKAHPDDAAYDLRARTALILPPGVPTLVPTGVHIELPVHMEAQIRPRSGLAAKHAITCLNAPGTIDAGYRGEISAIMMNFDKEPYAVQRGDRIAQMVICKLPEVELVPADSLSETERGAGGFGSTGKR